MKRCKLLCILILVVVLCAACGKNTDVPENTPTPTPAESAGDALGDATPTEEPDVPFVPEKIQVPTTNEELFHFITYAWKMQETDTVYEYLGEDLQKTMGKEDFADFFERLFGVGGELVEISGVKLDAKKTVDVYTFVTKFENATLNWQFALKGVKLTGFTYDIQFKDAFEIKYEDGVVEKYFVLQNDGYMLNAVYTYVNDGEKHPAVLLIAGSGPSDYNESVGFLAPFQDMALGLAKGGVNSLRLDKRTMQAAVGDRIGLEEEYYADCREAIAFLKEQNISNLYLLGHSLGGQIATQLAVEDSEIDGMILFNSTPRHLADVALDQYTSFDPFNEEAYQAFTDAAKTAKEETVQGLYYYGADDYYWATYNKLDTIANINDASVRTLIINSTYDNQIFQTDMDMWNAELAGKDNVTLHIYDDISHYGYKIDTKDGAAIYKKTDFPEELLEEFATFCE